MVGREGFEPSKAEPTDLQSVAFDRFAISPLICYVDPSIRPSASLGMTLLCAM